MAGKKAKGAQAPAQRRAPRASTPVEEQVLAPAPAPEAEPFTAEAALGAAPTDAAPEVASVVEQPAAEPEAAPIEPEQPPADKPPADPEPEGEPDAETEQDSESDPGPEPEAAPSRVFLAKTADEAAALSAADRENPKKLAGDALRDLGHRMGLPRSEMGRYSDDKVREQCEAITYRRLAEAIEADKG